MSNSRQQFRLRNRRIALLALPFVALMSAVLLGPTVSYSAVYTLPTEAPPNGDFGGPLNISSTTQTKQGGLNFPLGLAITNPAGNPNLNIFGQICWNGVCNPNWPSGVVPGQTFVAITPQTPPQQNGWIDVQGSATSLAALQAQSGIPTAGAYGFYGQDQLTSSASYGLYAAARVNHENSIALYAQSTYPTTGWAGYFTGNVMIESPYDLLVGGTKTNGDTAGLAEICLNDSCRSSWPVMGDLYWSDDGLAYSYNQIPGNTQLAVGGNSDANDPNRFWNPSGALFFADWTTVTTMTTNGFGSSNDLTIQ